MPRTSRRSRMRIKWIRPRAWWRIRAITVDSRSISPRWTAIIKCTARISRFRPQLTTSSPWWMRRIQRWWIIIARIYPLIIRRIVWGWWVRMLKEAGCCISFCSTESFEWIKIVFFFSFLIVWYVFGWEDWRLKNFLCSHLK